MYFDDSRPVEAVDFDWSAVEAGISEPLEQQFSNAPKTQACLEFARRVSEWLGRARTPKGVVSDTLALRIALGANEDDGTISQIAAHGEIDQPRLTRALQDCRRFMAGVEIGHLRAEKPEEPEGAEETEGFCE